MIIQMEEDGMRLHDIKLPSGYTVEETGMYEVQLKYNGNLVYTFLVDEAMKSIDDPLQKRIDKFIEENKLAIEIGNIEPVTTNVQTNIDPMTYEDLMKAKDLLDKQNKISSYYDDKVMSAFASKASPKVILDDPLAPHRLESQTCVINGSSFILNKPFKLEIYHPADPYLLERYKLFYYDRHIETFDTHPLVVDEIKEFVEYFMKGQEHGT